jgi:hypothetical protein
MAEEARRWPDDERQLLRLEIQNEIGMPQAAAALVVERDLTELTGSWNEHLIEICAQASGAAACRS